jgi:hypothetical protein
MIIRSSVRSRQPEREVWTHERLVRQRAIALGHAIDSSTWKSYGSALNSYLEFIRLHNMPLEPTKDTLSLYTVWMCHHIKPDSVDSYLSGICQQLEPYFPDIRANRKSELVARTLQGCMRLRNSPATRKRALTLDDLEVVIRHYESSPHLDDKLFVAMLVTGFFGLLRLGEMTFPDDRTLRNWRKVTRRSSVRISADYYSFLLPAHKADQFFEGNRVVVRAYQIRHNPLVHFLSYLSARDAAFPLASPLWLTERGEIPTRSFFVNRLKRHFDSDISGHSMRAGGATSLAENGAAPSIIQAMGRWAGNSFQIYIRKNPVLIQALLFARNRTAGMGP